MERTEKMELVKIAKIKYKEANIPTIRLIKTLNGAFLSPFNSLLVVMQNDESSLVGGYQQWLKQERKVLKGSSALWIWHPLINKKSEEDEPNEEIRFKLIPVFDISQTDIVQ